MNRPPRTGVTVAVEGVSSGWPVFGSCRVFVPLHWPATAVRASTGFTAHLLFAWTVARRVTRGGPRDKANPRKLPAGHLWTWGCGAGPMRVHESRADPGQRGQRSPGKSRIIVGMTVNEILAQLESLGDDARRAHNTKAGAPDNQ